MASAAPSEPTVWPFLPALAPITMTVSATGPWKNQRSKKGKKKNEKYKESLQDLWDTIKKYNVHNIGTPCRRKLKGAESLFKETMAGSFPSLGRDWTSKFIKLTGHPKTSV